MGLLSSIDSLFDSFRTGFTSAVGARQGTTAADQLDIWDKFNQPTKYGWSRNQYDQQLQYEQYVKELAASLEKSSATNLDYNVKLNQLVPTAVRQGLEAAGFNPILAALGQWTSQSGSISPSVGNTSLPTLPNVSRGGSTGFSAAMASKIFDAASGKMKSEVENVKQDTENKKVGNEDIRASANLKNAEADHIRAQTRTEDTLREDKRKDLVLKNRYGSSFTGDIGRVYETAVESAQEMLKPGKANAVLQQTPAPTSSTSARTTFNPLSPLRVKHPVNSAVMEKKTIDLAQPVLKRVLNGVMDKVKSPVLRANVLRWLGSALLPF